jgi:hypothetical protein
VALGHHLQHGADAARRAALVGWCLTAVACQSRGTTWPPVVPAAWDRRRYVHAADTTSDPPPPASQRSGLALVLRRARRADRVREVTVVQVRELLRRWLHAERGSERLHGEVSTARRRGAASPAPHRRADRGRSSRCRRDPELTDVLIRPIWETARPRRPDGRPVLEGAARRGRGNRFRDREASRARDDPRAACPARASSCRRRREQPPTRTHSPRRGKASGDGRALRARSDAPPGGRCERRLVPRAGGATARTPCPQGHPPRAHGARRGAAVALSARRQLVVHECALCEQPVVTCAAARRCAHSATILVRCRRSSVEAPSSCSWRWSGGARSKAHRR